MPGIEDEHVLHTGMPATANEPLHIWILAALR